MLNDNSFIGLSRYVPTSYIKGGRVEPEMRQYYSSEELNEIESDTPYIDNALPAELESIQIKSSNFSEMMKYSKNWLYDNCKCDGGYSRYATKTVSRRTPSF